MVYAGWPWYVPDANWDTVRTLMSGLKINRLTALALFQRGLHTVGEAKKYLACDLSDLGDPFSMSGAEAAAARLAAAIAKKEKVLVFGDYDVDGITATALLILVLQELEVPVEYHIPSRFADGYGLQSDVLEEFAARGGSLAVTVDCGTNSFAEMERAREIGLDLIITDHHLCFDGDRPACAVLNPKQQGCRYPEKQLAGVGVAWVLVRALYKYLGIPVDRAYRYLDLVAMGTIADVVPLQGENRILVKHGLERLQETSLPGLAALTKVSGLAGQRLDARQVAFTLTPRLNSAGRLGEAEPALRTLLAGAAEAEKYAAELDALNNERRQVEREIFVEAKALAAEEGEKPALVLWREGWNPGVIGIIAGRLSMEFGRPAALIALDGEEGRGSVRTVAGYNAVTALQECAAYLDRFGGHAQAAGLIINKNKITPFSEAFCRAVAKQEPAEIKYPVTAEVDLEELSLELAEELLLLSPFGYGNPEPLFLIREAEVVSRRRVGNCGNHLSLYLRQNAPVAQAIYFGAGEKADDFPPQENVELVVEAGKNTWQGRTSLSLYVKDMRTSLSSRAPVIYDRRELRRREQYILNLAGRWKLAVWVNTKAVKNRLKEMLKGKAAVTWLGRDLDVAQEYDALLFYHLPYERSDLERLLGMIRFRSNPRYIICYGKEDLLLNEKLFSATFPVRETLLKLAVCLEKPRPAYAVLKKACQQLSLPATNYLLEQLQTVFSEIAAGGEVRQPLSPFFLHQSGTYRRHRRMLAQYRAYQKFWWTATAGELLEYLKNPAGLVLKERELGQHESKSANVKGEN